ncbi:MAG: cbb3-type cytochrome oxidase assembly protein CcoS [Pseudomonadota bacterium]
MSLLVYLLPLALALGATWVAVFLWCMRRGQFDDPAGAAARILQDDPPSDEIR